MSDTSLSERLSNLVTSLPFFVLGSAFRDSPQPGSQLFGTSLYGVGTASMLYHRSEGAWRPRWRQLDYLAIGLSSCCLVTALRLRPRKRLRAARLACLAAVPLHPLAATAANILLAEGVYAVRARRAGGALARAHAQHVAVSAVAAALFVAEEVWPAVPLIHAAWHLAAVAAIAGFAPAIEAATA